MQHEADAILDVEFLIDLVQVHLHGAFGDPQLRGDQLVREAIHHEPRDRQLLWGERLGIAGARIILPEDPLQRATREVRFDPEMARGDAPDTA